MTYLKDRNGSEYYPGIGTKRRYALNSSKSQIYAVDKDLNQIFLNNGISDVYALDSNKIPYFPTDKDGNQKYGVDKDGNEFYFEIGDKQIYALNKDRHQFYCKDREKRELYGKLNKTQYYYAETYQKDQIYAKTASKNEYYIKNPDGPLYAKKDQLGNRTEYFAQTQSGKPIHAIHNETVVYPKNHLNETFYFTNQFREFYGDYKMNQFYRKDSNNREVYALFDVKKKIEWYARHPSAFYATTEFGLEYMANCGPIIASVAGRIVYPVNKNTGLPIYKIENGNPIYEMVENRQSYCYNYNGDFCGYAVDKNGDDILAIADGKPFYAFDPKLKSEVYPKKKGRDQFYIKIDGKTLYASSEVGEFYCQDRNKNDIVGLNITLPFYATLKDESQVYPKKSNKDQFYINLGHEELCASDSQKNFYYAKINRNEIYPRRFIEEKSEELPLPPPTIYPEEESTIEGLLNLEYETIFDNNKGENNE